MNSRKGMFLHINKMSKRTRKQREEPVAQEESMQWSSLPENIQIKIFNALLEPDSKPNAFQNDYTVCQDIVAFASVCRAWRKLALDALPRFLQDHPNFEVRASRAEYWSPSSESGSARVFDFGIKSRFYEDLRKVKPPSWLPNPMRHRAEMLYRFLSLNTTGAQEAFGLTNTDLKKLPFVMKRSAMTKRNLYRISHLIKAGRAKHVTVEELEAFQKRRWELKLQRLAQKGRTFVVSSRRYY